MIHARFVKVSPLGGGEDEYRFEAYFGANPFFGGSFSSEEEMYAGIGSPAALAMEILENPGFPAVREPPGEIIIENGKWQGTHPIWGYGGGR